MERRVDALLDLPAAEELRAPLQEAGNLPYRAVGRYMREELGVPSELVNLLQFWQRALLVRRPKLAGTLSLLRHDAILLGATDSIRTGKLGFVRDVLAQAHRTLPKPVQQYDLTPLPRMYEWVMDDPTAITAVDEERLVGRGKYPVLPGPAMWWNRMILQGDKVVENSFEAIVPTDHVEMMVAQFYDATQFNEYANRVIQQLNTGETETEIQGEIPRPLPLPIFRGPWTGELRRVVRAMLGLAAEIDGAIALGRFKVYRVTLALIERNPVPMLFAARLEDIPTTFQQSRELSARIEQLQLQGVLDLEVPGGDDGDDGL